MRSFVLALTKWFPELLQSKSEEPNEPANDEAEEQSKLHKPESDDEESAGDANEPHWQRLEKLRTRFEKLRQQNDEELGQRQARKLVPNDERLEPPKLIGCVHRILER